MTTKGKKHSHTHTHTHTWAHGHIHNRTELQQHNEMRDEYHSNCKRITTTTRSFVLVEISIRIIHGEREKTGKTELATLGNDYGLDGHPS